MPKIYRVQSISFPDERLLYAAQVQAKAQRRSLSNYVCGLIETDLNWDADQADAAERQSKVKANVRPSGSRLGLRAASSGGTSADAAILSAAAASGSGRTAKSRRK